MLINGHNSWSQLEEVWLGDVYPAAWYEHLAPDVRDVFQRLTEITQQDLNIIQQKLQAQGIRVRRPSYDKIDDFLDSRDQLLKPQICPRDYNIVIGNTLYRVWQGCKSDPWKEAIAEYRADPGSAVAAASAMCINGANVVRAGKDIIIDKDNVKDYVYRNEFPNYRVQVLDNGGHMDGCFAILRPGLILANHYFDDYERTFPGWEVIMLDNPTYGAAPSRGYLQPYPVYNGKFFDTTVGTNRTFNDHVIKHAQDWVGNYTETYFELNCLVINENTVMMLAENEQLANDLAQRGITVHWVPFRTRSFWDGGMHCLTVDIRRQSIVEDFFPERGC